MIAKKRAIKILSMIVIFLVVCVGLLAAYVPGETTQMPEEAVYSITEIPVSQVGAIAITNKTAKFGILTNGEQVEVVSDIKGDYDATECRGLVYAACHLTGSKKITDMSNVAQYGYENPTAHITLVLKDGSKVNLMLLMENPLDGNYYLYAEAEPAIYLISASVAELFMRQETDFFAHTVFPSITTDNYKRMEWVSIEHNGKGKDYTLVQKEGSFFLEEPIKQRIVSSVALKQLIFPLSALYSDAFIAAGAKLSDYGFREDSLQIRMKFDGRVYTALLRQGEDGRCLMANVDTGCVYELSSDSLEGFPGDYMTLLSGKAFSYAAGDIGSIGIHAEGKDIFVELSEDSQNSSLVAALNEAVISSQVSADEAEKISGSEVVTITYTLLSGSTEIVELIPAKQDKYYVRVNGIVNFTTTESYVQKVKKIVADYL